MNCPECNCELDYDEVDIGVGTMRGNYRCPNPHCSWTPEDETKLLKVNLDENNKNKGG